MGEVKAFAGALLGLALAGCAHVRPLPHGAGYTAMGSSYAAGAAMGGIRPGTPQRCGRSVLNYATLVATRLGLDLSDASCGGATTAQILGPWNELPAQIDAVGPGTRLVTITIGGNDVSFVQNLSAEGCTVGPTRCGPVRQVTEADWMLLAAAMRRIVLEVRAKAPQARIIFVDYVTIVPAHERCPALRLSPGDAEAMRTVATRLAALTASVARNERVELLAASRLSAHHTACDKAPWSVGAPGSAPGTPWHPNAAGHAAIADALVKMLRR